MGVAIDSGVNRAKMSTEKETKSESTQKPTDAEVTKEKIKFSIASTVSVDPLILDDPLTFSKKRPWSPTSHVELRKVLIYTGSI